MQKMKIVCTSDWHVSDRTHDICKHALDEVVQIVENEQPDFVMLLGDLTHVRGRVEGKSALLIKDTVLAMLHRHATVVAIPGNHDLYRNGDGSNLDAIFAHTDADDLAPDHEEVMYSNAPYFVELDEGVGAFMLPFYHKWQYDVEGTDADLVYDLEKYIKGALVTMENRGWKTKLCFTHMSIVGAQFDNEQVMKVGHDLAVSASAFDGFDLVVSGHMHRPQTLRMGTGEIVYIGALQPFTFGDRWDHPRAILVEIEDHKVSWSEYRLTVKEPLMRLVFDTETWASRYSKLSIPLAVQSFIAEAMEDSRGARVRVECHLTQAHLALLNKEWVASTQHALALKELKVLPRRTDNDLVESDRRLDRLSFRDLLDLWLREQPQLLPDERRAIQSWAGSIEDDHEVTQGDDAFDHKPQWTRLQNWKQWKDVTLDIKEWPETVCIHGDNAAGKSNLAEAEAFALYGENMKGTRLINCIREGESWCEVAHAFLSSGEEYVVRRRLTKRKDTTSTTLKLFHYDGTSKPKELSIGTNKETQAVIDRLAGPFDHYKMRFAQQQDIAALIEATDDQRMDIFQRLLRYDLATRSKAAHEQFKRQEEIERIARTTAEVLLEQNDSDYRNIPGWVSSRFTQDVSDDDTVSMFITAKTEERDEAKAEVERAEADERRRGARIRTIEAERATVRGKRDTLPLGDVESILGRQRAAQRALEDAQATLDRHRATEPPEVPPVDPTEVARAGSRLTVLTADLFYDSQCVDDYKRQLAGIDRDIARLESENETLRRTTNSATADLPCDSMRDDDDKAPWSSCRLMAQTLASVKRLEEIDLEHAALSEKAYSMKVAIDDATRDLTDDQDEASRQESFLNGLQKQAEERKAWEQWSVTLVAFTKHVDESAQRLADVTAEVEKARDDVEYARAARITYDKEIAEFDRKIADMEKELDDATKHRKEWQDRAHSYDLQLETLRAVQATLSRCRERREQAERETDLIAHSHRQQVALRHYRDACSRTGIPLIFLKQVVPQYEETVNQILKPLDLRYELQTTKTTTTNEERPALDQYFHDANGRHPVKEASGFQRVVLGVALRLALTKLHGELTGSGSTTVWQDEGWGAFSEQNIPLASELIQTVCAVMGGRYVYITHIPELQETARARINVTRSGSGSQIELVLG